MDAASLWFPASARAMRSNANGGRLVRQTATVCNFQRTDGETIEIGDEIVTIPTTPIEIDVATSTIDTSGGDTGLPPNPSAFHGVFYSNSRAADPALRNQLRLCEGTVGGRGGSGQYYLGSGIGDGENWRCIGGVYLNAAGQFVDTESQRFVYSMDNRRPRLLRATPGYVDNNAQTNVAFASGNYGPINAGIGDRVEYVAPPKSPDLCEVGLVQAVYAIVTGTAGATSQWGLGYDSTTGASVAAQVASAAANVMASCVLSLPADNGDTLHFVSMIASTGLGATWCADTGRHGAAADVPATYLVGWILQ